MSSVTSESGLTTIGLGGIVSPDTDIPALTYVGPPVTQQDALKSVLENVLCLPKDSGIRQALNAGKYTKINQVIGMPMASIKALSYKMRVGTAVSNVKLALSEEDTLIALQGFARFKAAALRQERLSPADWEIAHPNAQISDRLSTGLPRACSGLM